MSSSQLSSIQKPIVSLDFDLTENGEKRKCDIELSKDELSELVASLEAANKVSETFNLGVISSYLNKVAPVKF